jgi:indole-3-glycerol phosphate synthase
MSILERILERTRADVAAREAAVPLATLEARCAAMPPARDFAGAIRRPDGTGARRAGDIRVIAECKKASPSRGVIRADFRPADLARAYAAAGAGAISVLTDGPFFQGSLEDLAAVRAAAEVPLLRKDFHVVPYQLWEARAAGADAVLLIAAALSAAALSALLSLSRALGLAALVEVHDADDLQAALDAGATLLGVNNRDLKTFTVSLETTFRLLGRVPAGSVLVSESGIGAPAEVARLAAAGADAILVGEGLLKHADVGQALRRLVNREA